MNGTVKIRSKRPPFSVIPDYILEDTRMRTETRLVLGWLIGRPNSWEVRVASLQRTLGLSRDRWSKAKREMEKYGYLQQIRRKRADGTFVWEHIVTDEPMGALNSIAGKSSNGKSSNGKPGAGKPSNITTSNQQQESNTPLNPPLQITQACIEQARERFKGRSIEFLEEEWRAAVHKKGGLPRNPDKAFLGWAALYVANHA